MRQFVAYRNPNPASARVYPYLLNVQSDLIDAAGTRVMVPMFALKRGARPGPMALTPVLEIGAVPHVMMTPLLAGMDVGDVGKEAEDLSHARSTIMSALDLLISGI